MADSEAEATTGTEHRPGAALGGVLFSASEEFWPAAQREVTAAVGKRAKVTRIGPDIGWVQAADLGTHDLADMCRSRPLVFVRHLTEELARVPVDAAADPASVAHVARTVLETRVPVGDIALQVWVSGASPVGYGTRALADAATAELAAGGYTVLRAGCEHIASLCITPLGVLVGYATRKDQLTDWPGGRVRLARPTEQVSRAEFKLEELFGTGEVPVPSRGRAIDLGASPGGWTRILRQRGLRVWAVDPASRDPRVEADPGVVWVRTTAGEFLRSTDIRFDLAVNDMRMEPEMSSQVMVDTAAFLTRGGLAVVTLKISASDAVSSVRRCLATLGQAYEVLFARQLHHNRHEVTVVGRSRVAHRDGKAHELS